MNVVIFMELHKLSAKRVGSLVVYMAINAVISLFLILEASRHYRCWSIARSSFSWASFCKFNLANSSISKLFSSFKRTTFTLATDDFCVCSCCSWPRKTDLFHGWISFKRSLFLLKNEAYENSHLSWCTFQNLFVMIKHCKIMHQYNVFLVITFLKAYLRLA